VPEKSYYGYGVRRPHQSELMYFGNNQNVSGMATEDGKIILNPYLKNKDIDFDAVGRNEATRLYLREKKITPEFELTNKQINSFYGTPYEKNRDMMKHTILGRIISGDPSALDITEDQKRLAASIKKELESRGQ